MFFNGCSLNCTPSANDYEPPHTVLCSILTTVTMDCCCRAEEGLHLQMLLGRSFAISEYSHQQKTSDYQSLSGQKPDLNQILFPNTH